MPSWSQLMSRPLHKHLTRRGHFMENTLPTNCQSPHIVYTNTRFHPKTQHLHIHGKRIYTKSLTASWELGWLTPMPIYLCSIILTFFPLIFFWKYFIDDIFFIFQGSHSQLRSLMTFMNKINPTIKYTFTYSEQIVSILDVQIYLSESRKLKAKKATT